MHRANPNNFEPFVLHSPGVFWEHNPSSWPNMKIHLWKVQNSPGTFPSPIGTSVKTHCSHHSVMMARVLSTTCQRMDFHPPKLIRLNTHREPTLFPSWPQHHNDHLLPLSVSGWCCETTRRKRAFYLLITGSRSNVCCLGTKSEASLSASGWHHICLHPLPDPNLIHILLVKANRSLKVICCPLLCKPQWLSVL